VAVAEALTPFLIRHSAKTRSRTQRTTPRRTENITPIGAGLPKLGDDAISEDVLTLLETDPEVGKRSEPEFAAICKLLHITDDDDVIAGTILETPVGARLHERTRSFVYDEINRARQRNGRSPDEQLALYRERQIRLVLAHYMAARAVLPAGTRKVLLAFYILSVERNGGGFAASLAEVALKASVSVTTAYRHKNRLVALGWLETVYEATPNTGLANRYRLRFPSGTPKEVRDAIYTTEEFFRTEVEYVPQGVGSVPVMSARSGETLEEGGTSCRYIRRRVQGPPKANFSGRNIRPRNRAEDR
jgi:hypothetical protein